MKSFRMWTTVAFVLGAAALLLLQRSALGRLTSLETSVANLASAAEGAVRLAGRAAAAPAAGASCLGASMPSREELRALLREELRGAGRRGDEVPVAAPADDVEQPERVEAYRQAEHTVEQILSARVLTQPQLEQLRRFDMDLTLEQSDMLRRRLLVAANAGQLKIQVDGPFL